MTRRQAETTRLFARGIAQLVLGSALVAFAAAELVTRLVGFQPWRAAAHDNEPTMHEFDAELGWLNKPGTYEFAGYAPDQAHIRMTFLESHVRRTREDQTATGDQRPKILIVGGSFSQGWAISDADTFAWKLQEGLPGIEVLNHATGAYGTYQALLSLERRLPELRDPAIALYGFIEHHEVRSVAPASWMSVLGRQSGRGYIAVPYALLSDDGELIRRPPQAFPAFPFRSKLAVVALLERALTEVRARGRLRNKRSVTQALLQEMDAVSSQHGARFAVVLLDAGASTASHYDDFLTQRDIPVANCAFPMTRDMRIRAEGHPNGRMNSKWARCIEEFLRENLASAIAPGQPNTHPSP